MFLLQVQVKTAIAIIVILFAHKKRDFKQLLLYQVVVTHAIECLEKS